MEVSTAVSEFLRKKHYHTKSDTLIDTSQVKICKHAQSQWSRLLVSHQECLAMGILWETGPLSVWLIVAD